MKGKTGGIISLASMLVSIILMAFPIGAVLTFAPSPTERIQRTFSYFDLRILGMSGNIWPFLTAVLSVIICLILLLIIIKSKLINNFKKVLSILSIISFITSVLAMLYFFNFSIWGIVISALLLGTAILQFVREAN